MAVEPRDARFERLLHEHASSLGRLVAAYEPDAHEREDLLQDIAFALWQALPAFREDCSERTFVFRIAHNRALTHRHRRHRDAMSHLDDAALVVDARADPEATVARADERQRLMTAVRALPRGHREVVVLRLEGLSNVEAAQVLGLSENSVAIRLTRARKRLAQLLSTEAHA